MRGGHSSGQALGWNDTLMGFFRMGTTRLAVCGLRSAERDIVRVVKVGSVGVRIQQTGVRSLERAVMLVSLSCVQPTVLAVCK